VICPTCDGEGETEGDTDPFMRPPVSAAVCGHCLGAGEVPDDLTLDDLFKF